MSPTRRRTRRERAGAVAHVAPPPTVEPQRAPAATAPWNWRTFPVYFAFSLGLFIGVYLGFIAGVLNDSNGTVAVVVFIVAALFLGFGFSRLTTRFMINRRWVKPRAKRR